MAEEIEKSSYFWIFSLVALPPVVPLYYLFSPVANPEYYLKSFLCLQFILSIFLLRIIVDYKDVSFRIWLVAVIIIPLPLVIFLSRLYLKIEFIGIFYILLLLYSLALYRFRNGSGFVGTIIVLMFGPLFAWGLMELLPKITLDGIIDYSPIYIILASEKIDIINLSAFLISFFTLTVGSKLLLSKVFKQGAIF
ncbi:MAG: hypothetical protein COA79_05445 [Planctomycetota bacterium]|nr:MAG: hypothetical protein COA79_05445 [Planctomycetota bacterium]